MPGQLAGEIKIGQMVSAPFGSRMVRGFVVALSVTAPDGLSLSKIKPISSIVDPSPFFSEKLISLVKWIARYTLSPVESVIRAAVPAAVVRSGARPCVRLFVEPMPVAPEGLTERQKELHADLLRVGGGWLSKLVVEFKTSQSMFKTLEKKGAIKIYERQVRRNPLGSRCILPTEALPLEAEQAAALDVILSSDRPVLLHGVTGSGKTEIYLQAIANILSQGKGAIVLVPEISLTPQTVQRFAGRFGERVAVLHSALSDGERYDEWHRIRTGRAMVAVGPRSAVFAPVRRLGLLVVDEEHDSSYKQDETPRYNARDIAVVRAKLEGAKIVLGSATPSLESWHNAKTGKYSLATLSSRVKGRPMPIVAAVDMQEAKEVLGFAPVFSNTLLDAIRKRLDRGEQTILFLNRRGFSRSLVCPDCGFTPECPQCDLSYTYHIADDCLRCHICGAWQRVPLKCPSCGSPDFKNVGIGTQRAELALGRIFPKAAILRMDADSTSRKMSHDDILSAFRNREADILIGTQMIAKGLDFPNVTLVGVLNADISLGIPDFRASERTYQLLEQVSGRAGRADLPGEVYIQTFNPHAAPVEAVCRGTGYAAFADGELEARRENFYPPYARLAMLTFRSLDESKAASWAEMYVASLRKFASALKTRLLVSDAMPAAVAKANGWYRFQTLLRSPGAAEIARAVRWICKERPVPAQVKLAVDIDAVNLF